MSIVRIVSVLLAVGVSLLLSGCIWSERAVFPEWGEQAALEGTFTCSPLDIAGKPTGSEPQDFIFHEVSSGEGYKYYVFAPPSTSGGDKPEPISFTLHQIYRGFYVGQTTSQPGEAQYFWYGSLKKQFFYFEDSSMEPDMERLAKEHDIVLDQFTKNYYTALHGKEENIRAYLIELGPLYKGSSMRCADNE